jgi:hypothetical protein
LEKSKYLNNDSLKVLCEIVIFQGTRAEAVATAVNAPPEGEG